MLLSELFTSAVDYQVYANDAKEFSARSKIGSHLINFSAEREGDDNSWWVTFSAPKFGFNATGDGQPAKVLAFVKRCIEDLIAKHDPDEIVFSGAAGKDNVYRRMVERFIPKDKYRVVEKNHHKSTLFKVIKKDAE